MEFEGCTCVDADHMLLLRYGRTDCASAKMDIHVVCVLVSRARPSFQRWSGPRDIIRASYEMTLRHFSGGARAHLRICMRARIAYRLASGPWE